MSEATEMPQEPGPWWWDARQCWATQIDGKRHTAPKSIGRRDLKAAGEWFDTLRSRPASAESTVGELAAAWLDWDAQRVKAGRRDSEAAGAARARLRRICRTRLDRRDLGDWPAARLRVDHADALATIWRAKGVSPGYLRDLVMALKAMLAWASRAVEGRGPLIRSNPLAEAKVPPLPPAEERYAERSEAAAWLRWLRGRASRDFVLLQRVLIHTGARPSEWTRAKVSDLDVRRWVLTRRDWKAARATGRVRRVFVPVRLRRSLLRQASRLPSDVWLFTSPRGLRWGKSNLGTTTQRQREAARAAGVPLQARLTCYLWRHVAASDLLMKGVDIATVAELLGTSPQQITRTYGHLLKGHLAAAAERLAQRR
jgi:integrase